MQPPRETARPGTAGSRRGDPAGVPGGGAAPGGDRNRSSSGLVHGRCLLGADGGGSVRPGDFLAGGTIIRGRTASGGLSGGGRERPARGTRCPDGEPRAAARRAPSGRRALLSRAAGPGRRGGGGGGGPDRQPPGPTDSGPRRQRARPRALRAVRGQRRPHEFPERRDDAGERGGGEGGAGGGARLAALVDVAASAARAPASRGPGWIGAAPAHPGAARGSVESSPRSVARAPVGSGPGRTPARETQRRGPGRQRDSHDAGKQARIRGG